jgi:uncharacterized protein YijF (DUF1287 family)
MGIMRAILVITALVLTFAASASPKADKFITASLALEDRSVVYDPTYRRIAYPNGDVPAKTGVCSDVIVRAYRAIGIDLQKLVHEDMAKHFSLYPKTWRRTSPDSNIDHRRVLNLATFFRRHGTVLKVTNNPKDYAPGDIVTWNLNPKGSLPHIGIVTNRRTFTGTRPLMMHNIGGGQVLEDVLFAYTITGHFRYGID